MASNLRRVGSGILGGLLLAVACGKSGNTNSPGKEPTSGAAGEAGAAGETSAGGTPSAGGEKNAAGKTSAAGAAGEGPTCAGCDSGFCLDDGTCVDCLPSNDHCPSGQYCTDAYECEPGCKADGSSCASGVCDETHNCQKCIDDDECTPDLVCGAGVCAAACTAAHEGQNVGCQGDLTCCSLHCRDVLTDTNNCGVCGHACGSGQFCGSASCTDSGAGGAGGAGAGDCGVVCHDTTLANVCAISKVVVILDSSTNTSEGNRKPGREIGAALEAQCPRTPTLTEAEQDSVDALNVTTGQPVAGGGELLVVAGGPFFQTVEGYFEKKEVSPLYWYVGATNTEYRKRSNDEAVVSLPKTSDHDSHDFFIIQFMRDPTSGSLVLNIQGLWLSGTTASAYHLVNTVFPALADYDKAWYAYEWTDMDDDKQPDEDEISLVDSGN